MKRLAVGLLALLPVMALLSAPAPVRAGGSQAPPWRFTTVNQVFDFQAGYGSDVALKCPVGYRPVSGGVARDSANPGGGGVFRSSEYTDPGHRTFRTNVWDSLYAGSSAKVRISASCVGTEAFGTVEHVTKSYAMNSSTHTGGGRVFCPAGYRVIAGGADFDPHQSGNSLDYSTPVLDGDGYGVGWYAQGEGYTNLVVEAYCVEGSYLDAEYAEVDLSDVATKEQHATARATCAAGFRILTGGAFAWNEMAYPTHDHGVSNASGPATARNWPVGGWIKKGDRLAAVALCIPASKVSLQLTATPPAATNSSDATFKFSASDQAGENIGLACHLDAGATTNCASGSITYHGLSEGQHTFTVRANNESGSSRLAVYTWMADYTKPDLISWTPISSAPITGSITMNFSEEVRGVAAGLKVLPNHGNQEIDGAVNFVTPSVVRWTPAKPLVPGETYAVVLDGSIRDVAGNFMTPVNFSVRTDLVVENTSIALKEFWDTDADPVASGGRYITSRTAASDVGLSFTATAGQKVTVFGIKLPDGGAADVYLDGVKVDTASFYGASPARAKVYVSPALSAGVHAIELLVMGTHTAPSTGSWVSVDSITIGGSNLEETAFDQSFATADLSTASGGSYDTTSYEIDSDGAPAFQVKVVGSGVDVYGVKTPTSGKARILIDGVLKQTVDLDATSIQPNTLVFSSTFNDSTFDGRGVHVIRIEPVGTATGASSAVGIDRIVVH